MLEDGLVEVENLLDPVDLEGDSIRAKYLKMADSVSFSDIYSYVIELPVTEHWKPEVKAAKRNDIKIFTDYNTFEEVQDQCQDTIGG